MPRLQTPCIPTDVCLLVEIPQKSLHFTFCPCRGLDHCGCHCGLCCGHGRGSGHDLRWYCGLCCGHLNQSTHHCSSRQELSLKEKLSQQFLRQASSLFLLTS